jgi:hypothetical protein
LKEFPATQFLICHVEDFSKLRFRYAFSEINNEIAEFERIEGSMT